MKKVIYAIKNAVVWAIVILAIAMMMFTIISVSTFDRLDRNLMGYRAFIVLSDSMSSSGIDAGDLVLVKETNPSTLRAGDIIAYQSVGDENYGEVVTHMIRSVTMDDTGNLGFITFGTTTDTDDPNVVSYTSVLGKYEKCIPGVGKFFQFLKTTPGYIVCIFLPFLILILIQGFNSIRLFKRYKSEQLEEIEAERQKQKDEMETERKKLEEERLKSQEMMAELMKMKEAMAEVTMNQSDKPNKLDKLSDLDQFNKSNNSNEPDKSDESDKSNN